MTCAVYFNLDETLTEFTKEFSDIYSEAVDEAGLDELTDAYEDYTDKFFTYFRDNYAFPRRQAMDELAKEHDCYDAEKVEAFADAWDEIEAGAVTLKDGVEEMLDELSDSYSLGILSNGTGELQRDKLERLGIADYFDQVLISTEEATRKPEPDFFQAAMDAVDADTYVMVSHHAKRDIVPARKAKFQAVWLSDTDQDVPEKVATTAASVDEIADAVADLCGE